MAAVIQLRQSPFWAKREKRENVPPARQPNQTSRTREYLTPDEVEWMVTAARQAGGRLVERDALLIMRATALLSCPTPSPLSPFTAASLAGSR
jgi:hypothetical protein